MTALLRTEAPVLTSTVLRLLCSIVAGYIDDRVLTAILLTTMVLGRMKVAGLTAGAPLLRVQRVTILLYWFLRPRVTVIRCVLCEIVAGGSWSTSKVRLAWWTFCAPGLAC